MHSPHHPSSLVCLVLFSIVGCTSLAGLDDLQVVGAGAAGTSAGGSAGTVGDSGTVESSQPFEGGLSGKGGSAGTDSGASGNGNAGKDGGTSGGGGGQAGGAGAGGTAGAGGVASGGGGGTGGESGTAGFGGSTGGTGGASGGSGGTAGLGGAPAGAGGQAGQGGAVGCAAGHDCVQGLDAAAWTLAGKNSGGVCSAPTLTLFDKVYVDSTDSSSCTYSCGFTAPAPACHSTVSCHSDPSCSAFPSVVDVDSSHPCVGVWGGTPGYCLASEPSATGDCAASAPQLLPEIPVPAVGCFQATSSCSGGVCVAAGLPCIATANVAETCPTGYSSRDYYTGVQDTRACPAAVCALSCGLTGGALGITAFADLQCGAELSELACDNGCKSVGPLQAVTLNYQPICGPTQAIVPANGEALHTGFLRVCCKK